MRQMRKCIAALINQVVLSIPVPGHPAPKLSGQFASANILSHEWSHMTRVRIKEIIMYFASWCGICKNARAYFDDQGIYYTEYDVENDPQGSQDYARPVRRGVPIILIGDQRMDGFSKASFQQLYTTDN